MNDRRLKRRGSKNGQAVWTAILPLPRDASGARRQHRFTFVGTKKDAEKSLVAEISAIDGGTFVATDRTTFGQYIADWLSASKSTFAGKTWEVYEGMARIRVIPTLGDVALQRLSASQLSKAYSGWRESGLTGQTLVHHHRLIHRVLSQALREGRVRQNVAAIVDTPKATRREMRFLTMEEIARIFEVAADTRMSPVVALALATGARRGELLGLKWDDVDFNRGTVAIRRSLEQTRNGIAEKPPKSGRSRVVNLTASAIETLRRWRRTEADAYGIGRVLGTSYVFCAADGSIWAPNDVTAAFRKIARLAGVVPPSTRKRPTTRAGRKAAAMAPRSSGSRKVGEVTFHSLRHTCATLLLTQGVHPKVVQEMLGHSTVSITMDLYSHVTPSLQSEAATKLEAVLRLPAGGSATA